MNIGNKFYWSFKRGFVIPVTVIELDYVRIASKETVETYNLINTTLWHYVYGNKTEVVGYIKPIDNNIWGFINLPIETINNTTVCSEFTWIDEPLGHELSSEKLYYTVEEALFNTDKITKLKAHRAHKKLQSWRTNMCKFIQYTHIAAGDNNSVVLNHYIDKPIYKKIK